MGSHCRRRAHPQRGEGCSSIRAPAGQSGAVLDISCGTGLVGVALRRAGKRHLIGLAPSSAMIEVCSGSGIYDSLITASIDDRDVCWMRSRRTAPLRWASSATGMCRSLNSHGPGAGARRRLLGVSLREVELAEAARSRQNRQERSRSPVRGSCSAAASVVPHCGLTAGFLC